MTVDSTASSSGNVATSAAFWSQPVAMQTDEWWTLDAMNVGNPRVHRWTVSGLTVSQAESAALASSLAGLSNSAQNRHANTLIRSSASVAWVLGVTAVTNGQLSLTKVSWSGCFTVSGVTSGAAMPNAVVAGNLIAPKLDGDTQKAIYITAGTGTTPLGGDLVWLDETFTADAPAARCVAFTGQSRTAPPVPALVDTARWRVAIGSASDLVGCMPGQVVLMPRDANPGRPIIEYIAPVFFNGTGAGDYGRAPGAICGKKIALFGSAQAVDGYGMISVLEIADAD
jgi:hypothetical protein